MGFVQDVAPITAAGKLYSVFLIAMGMVLLGTFTGMVADYFISTDIENKLDTLLKPKSNSETDKL